MTSRDEAMRRRLAPALATADREYRASSGEVPIELLAPLFAAILTFGVFLTAFVPFGYVNKAAAELGRGQILQTLWFVALAGLSLFVLLRWCAVQTMAFIVHCKLKTNRPDFPTTWPLVSILVPAYQEATHFPVIEGNELKGIVSIGDLVKPRLDEKELEASVLRDISRMRA